MATLPPNPTWATCDIIDEAHNATRRQLKTIRSWKGVDDSAEFEFDGGNWKIGDWLEAFEKRQLTPAGAGYKRGGQASLHPDARYRVVAREDMKHMAHAVNNGVTSNLKNCRAWLLGACWEETVFVFPESGLRCGVNELAYMAVTPVTIKGGVARTETVEIAPEAVEQNAEEADPEAQVAAARAFAAAVPGGNTMVVYTPQTAERPRETFFGHELQIRSTCAWHALDRQACKHREGNKRRGSEEMTMCVSVQEAALADLDDIATILEGRDDEVRAWAAAVGVKGAKLNRKLNVALKAVEAVESLKRAVASARVVADKKKKIKKTRGGSVGSPAATRSRGRRGNKDPEDEIMTTESDTSESEESEEEVMPKKRKRRALADDDDEYEPGTR
ncbi:hypothetical protein A1Q2_08481 [Trichosporon asahii var. asahii CBS 8904]|uniref:Uncharacterized protein n=1 Tax=Trichosporon asahii var. asahii (strain CBS 8904) TaxID=1220162 RepID=K1UZY7_TRIAC|nr:hypothetical protein A1Q2_08481 [Trichosporon asahii var. asahii CBS 8904]